MIHLLPATSWKLSNILPSTYRHCCPTWQPQRMAVLQDFRQKCTVPASLRQNFLNFQLFWEEAIICFFFSWGEVASRKVQTVNSCGVDLHLWVYIQVYTCYFQGLCFLVHPGRLFFANWMSMSDFMWFSRKTGMITPLSRDDTQFMFRIMWDMF